MRNILIGLSIFALSAGTAFAEQGRPVSGEMWHGPAMASTSTTTWHKSVASTSMMNKGQGKPLMQQQGLPGMVASVGTSSFAMTLPGNREHATSTFTVNVTASTTYQRASTTATFANVTVGAKVVVIGKVASSTKTIAAQRVVIVGDGPGMHKKEGMLERLKHFLFGRHGGDDGMENDTDKSSSSAAAVEGSGLSTLLKSFFSWI